MTMLKEKYDSVLKLGEKLAVQDGYVKEEGGKLKIGGSVEHAFDKDRLWDAIKQHTEWESEVEADITVRSTGIYGMYTVQGGDTLSKIAKWHLGSANRYPEIFEMNRDILDNPDLIKVGQKLKLPNKS
jgi:LysM repeat protein